MYSYCSFLYVLISSIFTFLSFWTLVLVGLLLLHRDAVFRLSRLEKLIHSTTDSDNPFVV